MLQIKNTNDLLYKNLWHSTLIKSAWGTMIHASTKCDSVWRQWTPVESATNVKHLHGYSVCHMYTWACRYNTRIFCQSMFIIYKYKGFFSIYMYMYCETRKIIFILKSKRNGLKTSNLTEFVILELLSLSSPRRSTH